MPKDGYHSTDGQREPSLVAPVLLGILQIPWVALFEFSSLFWEGEKNLLRDSIYVAIGAIPSISALVVGVRRRRCFKKLGRYEQMSVCSVVCVVAALILGWFLETWIRNCLLDRNGTWSR
jgi:hypothetical protein